MDNEDGLAPMFSAVIPVFMIWDEVSVCVSACSVKYKLSPSGKSLDDFVWKIELNLDSNVSSITFFTLSCVKYVFVLPSARLSVVMVFSCRTERTDSLETYFLFPSCTRSVDRLLFTCERNEFVVNKELDESLSSDTSIFSDNKFCFVR